VAGCRHKLLYSTCLQVALGGQHAVLMLVQRHNRGTLARVSWQVHTSYGISCNLKPSYSAAAGRTENKNSKQVTTTLQRTGQRSDAIVIGCDQSDILLHLRRQRSFYLLAGKPCAVFRPALLCTLTFVSVLDAGACESQGVAGQCDRVMRDN
jgi:hypothetical protein